MPFAVWLTDDAARDLAGIVDYIARHHGAAEASRVLQGIEKALATLEESPERGSYAKELLALGIKQYRELLLKPYRLIYSIDEADVFVVVVADSRCDFRALLERRLLEG